MYFFAKCHIAVIEMDKKGTGTNFLITKFIITKFLIIKFVIL